MTKTTDTTTRASRGWTNAVLAGLISGGIFLVLGAKLTLAGIIGIAAFLIVGLNAGRKTAADTSAVTQSAVVKDTSVASEAPKAAPKAAPAKAAKVKLNTLLPGSEELATRKGSWKYQGQGA
ncbi:hypothetical protein [Thalassovita sp.]|uniref:hypothetical protein n=1 Tax=Thalassovita sp. TaxID=1979401 RepID=UPI002B26FC17|nr:hypothetical protein [Thalassovita sp.]